jgi:hypothetical protein
VVALPSNVSAQAVGGTSSQSQITQLMERIRELEQRLARLSVPAPAQTAQAAQQQNPPANPQAPAMPMPMPAAQTGPLNPEGIPPDSTDPQALLDRIKALEQRIRDLESSTVLSEPETRVRKIEVYVDKEGNIHDQPVPGAERKTTYQRERVYRRQTINEKIEEALEDAASHSVQVGVDAGIVAQFAHRTKGDDPTLANNHAYELASADLFFTAGVAQHTLFFADIVGLSGPPPEGEIPVLSLINGYTARLFNQNRLDLREAWLRTELFGQRLAVTAGRLDLTNYFDHNVAANDETTQFISDALVNNQALGLSENGAGLAIVYDPKTGLNFKVGLQQSNSNATSLSDSIFSLAEIGYLVRPPGLSEGNYRVWYRTDNGGGAGYNVGYGVSIDQKILQGVTLFGRYGASDADVKRNHFYSGGVQFDNGRGFFPGDAWGLGYAQNDYQIEGKERLVEGYYRFGLTEKLNLSFHLQHFLELLPGGGKLGYLVPGVRLQASF